MFKLFPEVLTMRSTTASLVRPKYALLLAVLLLVSACQRGGGEEAGAQNVLARVDGQPITSAMVDQLLALKGQNNLAGADQRREALNELIRIQAVANRALEQGIDAQPEVWADLAVNRQRILLNHFSNRFLSERPLTDEELRQAYDTTVKRSGQQQVRLESILFQDEQAAVSALLAAEEGTGFEVLAEQARGAGRKVETLDWVDLSQLPEDYAGVVSEMPAGAVIPVPLRDQIGGQSAWRVLRLLERRRFQPPAFDEVRPGLERQLRRQKLQEWSQRLLDKAKVEMADGSPFDSGRQAAAETETK